MAESAPPNEPKTENVYTVERFVAVDFLTALQELTQQMNLLLKSDSPSESNPDAAFQIMFTIIMQTVSVSFSNMRLTETLKIYREIQQMIVAYLKLNRDDPQKKSMLGNIKSLLERFAKLVNPFQHPKEVTITKDELKQLKDMVDTLKNSNKHYEEQHNKDTAELSSLKTELEKSTNFFLQQIKESKERYETQFLENQEYISENMKTLDNKNAEIAHSKSVINKNKILIEKLEASKELYETQLLEKELCLSEHIKTKDMKNAEIAQLKSELNKEKKLIDELRASEEIYKMQLSQNMEIEENKNEQIARFKSELNKARKLIEELQSAEEIYETQLSHSIKTVDKKNAEVALLKSELNKANCMINELKTFGEFYETQLSQSKKQEAETAQIAYLTSELNKAQICIKELKCSEKLYEMRLLKKELCLPENIKTEDIENVEIAQLNSESEKADNLINDLKTLCLPENIETEVKEGEHIEIGNLKSDLEDTKNLEEQLKIANEIYENKFPEEMCDVAISKTDFEDLRDMVNILKQATEHCENEHITCCHTEEVATQLKELEGQRKMVAQLTNSNATLEMQLIKYKKDYMKIKNDLKESLKKVASMEKQLTEQQQQKCVSGKQQPKEQRQKCVLSQPYQEMLSNFRNICVFCNTPRNKKAFKIVGGTYQACVIYLKRQRRDLTELNELRVEILDMIAHFGINEDPQLDDSDLSSDSSEVERIE